MDKAYNVLTNAAFKSCKLTSEEKNTIYALYRSEGRQNIYDYAQRKKILPFISVLLSGLEIDEADWKSVIEEYRTRNEAVIDCLDTVFQEFAQRGIKKVFVTENFGALLAADADTALFASGDVDIYADIKEKDDIYEAFKWLGYKMKERYSFNSLINTTFSNDKLLPGGFNLGVAWNPLSRMKLPCIVNADEFVEWEKLWKYKNTAINLPNIDALMYICLLHVSLHSFSRAPDIRLYIDIINVSKLPVDWDKILDYARRDKTMVRVLTACMLAKQLVCAEMPDFILKDSLNNVPQISKLLKLVYDDRNNCLLYEPQGFKVMEIEALSNDSGFIIGLIQIMFPDKNWVKDTYNGQRDNIIVGYFKHIRNLF